MIDWVTAYVPYSGPVVHDGRLLRVHSDGSVAWEVLGRLVLEGSYDSRVAVKSDGPHYLWVSGNPTRWLQGHNVDGPDSLLDVLSSFSTSLSSALSAAGYSVELSPVTDWRLSRVDITYSVDLGSEAYARAALRYLERVGRVARRGRGVLYGDESVYWGLGSRYWTLVCYRKAPEVVRHRPRVPVEVPPGLLRWELRLRARELAKMGLERVAGWSGVSELELWRDYVGRLEVPRQMVREAVIESLPPRLAGVYLGWVRGVDWRARLARATFYRYRRELLDRVGVDIAVPALTSEHEPELLVLSLPDFAAVEPWRMPSVRSA